MSEQSKSLLARLQAQEHERIRAIADERYYEEVVLEKAKSFEAELAGKAEAVRKLMFGNFEKQGKSRLIQRLLGREIIHMTFGYVEEPYGRGQRCKIPYIETPILMAREVERVEDYTFVEGWVIRADRVRYINVRENELARKLMRERNGANLNIYWATQESRTGETERDLRYQIFPYGKLYAFLNGEPQPLLEEAESTHMEIRGVLNAAIEELNP